MRYLIKFSYDGSAYSGFQTQKGKETIQEKVEEALKTVNNHQKTNLIATGRTDKGVHALCQYGHADIQASGRTCVAKDVARLPSGRAHWQRRRTRHEP